MFAINRSKIRYVAPMGSGPVLLPKMAAQHNNGPPHLIATWPTGNDLQGLLRPGTVKTWEVGSWGEIALGR